MTPFVGSHKIKISNSLKQVKSQGLEGKGPKKHGMKT